MTVETEISRSGPYAGAGTTGPFLVDYRILDATHLRVVKRPLVGSEVTLAYPADYLVTGVGDPTSSLTTTLAVLAGETLTIIRDVPKTQEADYVQNDDFPAETHENALDKLTMIVQQLDEELDRSLTLPVSAGGVSTELPVPQSNALIGWNSDADALQNVDPATLATVVAFGTTNADLFSGTGAQTVFTLTANPGIQANLDVAVSGVTQRPGIDYTWSGGTSLTFTTAPPIGTNNVLARYQQGLPQAYNPDFSDTTDASKGDALIGVKKIVAGAVGTTQHEVNERRLSPFDFMTPTQIANAKARTAQDLAAPLAVMAAAANVIASAGGSPCFEWPNAQFSYSTSPNWAVPRLSMIGVGMPEFKHTGAGVAFLCDASGFGGAFVGTSMKFDNLLITGNAATTFGLSVVRIADGTFSNIRVRNAAARAFDIRSVVYSKFDTCMNSVNADGAGAPATRGFYIGSSAGVATTDCTFVNCIAEGNLIGWDLAECDFNVIVGGTGEACTAYGVAVNPLSKGNQLIGMTGEANVTADIIDQGRGTIIQGGYFTNLLSFAAAARPILRDAQCNSVLLDASTSGASVRNIRYSSFGAGGTFVNNSPNTYPKNVFNGNTSVLAYGDSVGRNPTISLSSVTVTATPFTYTNTSTFAEQIIVRNAAGTVTQVSMAIAGFLGSPTTVGGGGGLSVAGIHTLYPGDQLVVSYAGAVGSIDMVRRPL